MNIENFVNETETANMALENTHYGAAAIEEMLSGGPKKIFFAGIGGISMCSLARVSQLRGHTVSGYDRAQSDITCQLTECGITVYYEGDCSHVDGCDMLVYTVAIPPDNPEYTAAKAAGIPCISRADYLGYLMSGYGCRIGVSGMHGKSTTTSMLEKLFSDAGRDPTVSCGARMVSQNSAHRIGGEEYFIFEACEYMDSFLDFYPTIAIILNIEMDHVDYFHSMEQIHTSFHKFLERTEPDGIALVNCADDDVMRAAAGYEGRLVTFGVEEPDADYCAYSITFEKGCARFTIRHHGDILCTAALQVPGAHAVCDALAAAAAAHLCGISGEEIARALEKFQGLGRRMEPCGKAKCGAAVYSDYAHHPTEIAASLTAAEQMGFRRIFCVFQPHTYSRTSRLFDDFAAALSGIIKGEIILAPIYSAREVNTYGVSAERLSDAIVKNGARCRFIAQFEDIADYLNAHGGAEDMFLIMGAGDVIKVIPHL